MSQVGPDQDYLAVVTPGTPAAELQRIAAARPDLHPHILVHPHVYPDLAVWIQSQAPPPPSANEYPTPQNVPDVGIVPPQSLPQSFPQPTAEPAVQPAVQPMVPPAMQPPAQPPAQVAMQPPAATNAEPKKRLPIPPWAIGAVAGGAAVVVAAVLWLLLSGDKGQDSAAYNALPTEGVVVDVSTFGRDITLVPIGKDG